MSAVTTTKKKQTGSRESGVTLHISNHLVYSLPNVPSGSAFSLWKSRVFELMRGRFLRILRPSGESSIVSRNFGNVEPPVVSPRAATISAAYQHGKTFQAIPEGLTATLWVHECHEGGTYGKECILKGAEGNVTWVCG